MRYFQEANNVTELLSTTAADFLAKHYLADEISVPVRMSIEVKPRDNATDVLGERSFEIELSGLRRGPDSSWECPSLNDMLERLSVASAPRSLQNGPIPQELIIYDVILQFRGIEIVLILQCLCRRFRACIFLLRSPRRFMLDLNCTYSHDTVRAVVALLCHLSYKA